MDQVPVVFSVVCLELSYGCVGWIGNGQGLRALDYGPTMTSLQSQLLERARRRNWVIGRLEAASNPMPPCWTEEIYGVLNQGLQKPLQTPLILEGTPFQKAVWQALGEIPRSEVRTYGQLAERIGHPRACRAVGSACGANPFPFLIPCHRAVASGGALGGFGLGIELKKLLLKRERLSAS